MFEKSEEKKCLISNKKYEETILPKMNLLNIPISLIDTRDCFVFDPIIDIEILNLGPGRDNVIKKTFYFDPDVIPSNFDKYLDP